MGINVPDLGVTVTETQSHHPLMDLLEKRSATFHVYMINGIHLPSTTDSQTKDILKCMFASSFVLILCPLVLFVALLLLSFRCDFIGLEIIK